MVKAELSHNPYLLITKAKFNEQEPRINSQIEKYENQPLKDWVHMVPSIFYNEMNGYDFEFNFTGTKTDFNEIKAAFKDAEVTAEQVRFFHKNEIEDADVKSEEIDRLIAWLKENPNRKFNFEEFWEKYSELFEKTYPLVIINGDYPIDVEPSISVEKVKSAYELQNTNLTSTPILFVVNASDLNQFRKDLVAILSREDVRQEQLFFVIDPCLEENYVIRLISDFGVEKPQIVRSSDDELVARYIRDYPVTEYVREVIKVISFVTKQIGVILEDENSKSEITNAGIHARINALEEQLVKLKEADDFFVQRDNYDPPEKFVEVRQNFDEQLHKWKNRKTKIVGDGEAEEYAKNFSAYINKILTTFCDNIQEVFQEESREIASVFSTVYENGAINREYVPTNVMLREVEMGTFPDLTDALLEKKDVSYEAAKADFFGLFKKSQDEPVEMVKVVTCNLDEWRSVASNLVMPIVDQMIMKCHGELLNYYESLAESYHSHLSELIDEKQMVKENVISRLSDDERKLQEDNDWLAEVNNKLQMIERG